MTGFKRIFHGILSEYININDGFLSDKTVNIFGVLIDFPNLWRFRWYKVVPSAILMALNFHTRN